MTIKSRNRIILIFFGISLSLLVFGILQFIIAAVNHGVTPPEGTIRTVIPFDGKGPFTYNFTAVIISIFAFGIYTSAVSIIIYLSFEKTQSIEIIYFLLFLFSCLIENVRILMAEFDLWQTYSKLLIYIGKAVIASRIIAPVSLLFASLFNETSQRQNVERNLILIIVVSISLGILYPLDTLKTTSTLTVMWGYRRLFITVRIFVFLSTVLSMIINAVTNSSIDMYKSVVGYVALVAGYLLLIGCDNYFNLIAGSVLLAFGTFRYLRYIHKIYLWN